MAQEGEEMSEIDAKELRYAALAIKVMDLVPDETKEIVCPDDVVYGFIRALQQFEGDELISSKLRKQIIERAGELSAECAAVRKVLKEDGGKDVE